MQTLIRHDDNIPGDENLASRVRALVEGTLERYGDQITTVEIHLADENHDKRGGDDKRCSLEVHVKGQKPQGVSHKASDLLVAVQSAADKMARMLDSHLGKLRNHHQPLNPDKPLD